MPPSHPWALPSAAIALTAGAAQVIQRIVGRQTDYKVALHPPHRYDTQGLARLTRINGRTVHPARAIHSGCACRRTGTALPSKKQLAGSRNVLHQRGRALGALRQHRAWMVGGGLTMP